jgi:hypothetical protein
MGPIGCPETSVKDYHSTLRNTPEQHISSKLAVNVKRLFGSKNALSASNRNTNTPKRVTKHRHFVEARNALTEGEAHYMKHKSSQPH